MIDSFRIISPQLQQKEFERWCREIVAFGAVSNKLKGCSQAAADRTLDRIKQDSYFSKPTRKLIADGKREDVQK